MKLKEVLNVLNERGHPLTRASLYRAGLKNNFLTKESYGKINRYVIDEEKFNDWLNKATEKIPNGMMTLSEIAKELNVTYSVIKNMVINGELDTFNYGAGRGVSYAKLRDAEIAIAIHKQNN